LRLISQEMSRGIWYAQRKNTSRYGHSHEKYFFATDANLVLVSICDFRSVPILACYTAAPYCNILVFAKISVLHGIFLGYERKYLRSAPRNTRFCDNFFFIVSILSKNLPVQKKNLHTYRRCLLRGHFSTASTKILLGGKLATVSTH